MAIVFDPVAKRIILDSALVTASEIWSRWVDWHATGDNSKYPVAMRELGGDDLGSGLLVPLYYFLLNGWRVRPMEANHLLTITGNLFVDGGGSPVVNTLGNYNVSVQYTVPVQAQGISTSGSSLTATEVWTYPTRTLTDSGGGSGGSGGTLTAVEVRQEMDANSVKLAQIKAILDSMHIPTAVEIRQEMDNNSSKLTNIDNNMLTKTDYIALS